MTLLELSRGSFNAELVAATAPGLAEKLPPVAASRSVVGELSSYFVTRYGFKKGTPVVAFTGDNPSSLVGMGASVPGTAVISMGTPPGFVPMARGDIVRCAIDGIGILENPVA